MEAPYLGSDWRCWDLHVHTPASYENFFPGSTYDAKWDKYIQALKILDGVAVIGITDYCTLSGYHRVRRHFENGELPNIEEVIPNIEFRLTETTREGRSINVHVIAAPSIANELPGILLSRLRFSHAEEKYSCQYDDLVRLGYAYAGDSSFDERRAFVVGAEQFKVTREHLDRAFRDSETLRDNALIALPNSSGDGGSGLRESGQRAMREELYRLADIIFSANPADRQHFLGIDGKMTRAEIRSAYGGHMPCIGGSDAHTLNEIARPDNDRHTWIKADTSFHGLVQICYEPEYRVSIGENPPTAPVHRIESVTIDIPDDAVLELEDGYEPFCFRGERTIGFSPGLTCIIGGRGSGKSTLLSLMQEAAKGESRFFKRREITSGDTSLPFADVVELRVTSSPETIEFLDQNQIEVFALDHKRLTDAVYKRLLKQDREGELSEAVASLETDLDTLQRLQELTAERHEKDAFLKELRAEEEATERLIESLRDEGYVELVAQAEELNGQISNLRIARESLAELSRQLEDIIAVPSSKSPASPSAPEVEESYSDRADALRKAVRQAIEEARAEEDLDQPSKKERKLQDELESVNERIAHVLDERGISEENARDLLSSTERLTEIREAISKTEEEIRQLRNQPEELERVPDSRRVFEETLERVIDPINEELSEGADDELRRISIAYKFDLDAAIESCQEKLIRSEVQGDEVGRQLRSDHVESLLDGLDWDDFPSDLSELKGWIRTTQGGEGETADRIINYLSKPGEFERFRMMVEEHLTDALRFKRVEIHYDGKPLDRASFGQRCSAALIILLMLGNQPIVIDEPEAHLDSALIGSLLVGLIKRRKSERQIIFATHNANFVVNGDSELIHILFLEGNDPTELKSTSLENPSHRQAILQLEGGEEAFAQREKRYGFRSRFLLPSR